MGKLTQSQAARKAIGWALSRLVDADLDAIFGDDPVTHEQSEIQACGRDAAIRTMIAKFPFLKDDQ